MDTRKIIQALAYLAYKQPTKQIGNIKAYKLLWLSDRYHVRHYGRTITGDTYYAMPKGVVPSDVKHILDGKDTILKTSIEPNSIIETKLGYYNSKEKPNMKVFSKTDCDVMNLVLDNYNKMSANKLSILSHNFPEWKHYENELKDKDSKNSYKIDMSLFFINYDDGTGLFMDDGELLSLTKNLYFSHYGA